MVSFHQGSRRQQGDPWLSLRRHAIRRARAASGARADGRSRRPPYAREVDWTEAEKQIAPLLAGPGDWQHFRTEFERRNVTMLALVGGNPPYSVQAHSEPGGLRTAGIDWRRLDAFRNALGQLLDELDTGTTAPPRRRPTRHGTGKKGRRNR